MNDPIQQIQFARDALEKHFGAAPKTAFVAGSGLGAFVDSIDVESKLSYDKIPGFPRPTTPGHSGEAIVGTVAGRRILALSGRNHLYEGAPASDAIFAVRAISTWGCKILIATNAAGGVNPRYRPGDLMLIADHLNLTFRSPLRGVHHEEWGSRFPDLSATYDPQLREAFRAAAQQEEIALHEGVYAANLGPTFETPAEGKLLDILGADAVGMSTAPETTAAHQMGMRVVGLSYISNSLVHRSDGKTTHEEVLANSRLVLDTLKRLLHRVLKGRSVKGFPPESIVSR